MATARFEAQIPKATVLMDVHTPNVTTPIRTLPLTNPMVRGTTTHETPSTSATRFGAWCGWLRSRASSTTPLSQAEIR
jgi:hypothetical protein